MEVLISKSATAARQKYDLFKFGAYTLFNGGVLGSYLLI